MTEYFISECNNVSYRYHFSGQRIFSFFNASIITRFFLMMYSNVTINTVK
jgi:hypothetical protein